MRISPFRFLPAAAMLPICLLAGCHKPAPAPGIDDLSAALQRSADQAIAAPSLVDVQLIVPQRPGQLATQTKEIEQIFTDAGGTGLDSVNAKGQTSILGTVPVVNLAAFKARVNHQLAAMTSGPISASTTVEVLIDTPHPSPSPTP
jgi:hypothetical protein